MLGYWLSEGSPSYPWMTQGQNVAFISSIGAEQSVGYPLFIAGSTVTVVVFSLAFISERWLRHRGRLTRNYSTAEKVLSVFAIIFALIGAAGLILLTIFDTARHNTLHQSFLGVFMYVASKLRSQQS